MQNHECTAGSIWRNSKLFHHLFCRSCIYCRIQCNRQYFQRYRWFQNAPYHCCDCLCSQYHRRSDVNQLGLVYSAGIGVAEKVCMFIMLVPIAFMQSLSSFVGQNEGAGHHERSRRAMFYGMAFSFGLGLIMAAITFFHGDILAGIFSNEQDTVIQATEYLKAYAIDTLLVSFLFCFSGYYNGCGKTTFVMIQGLIGAFGIRIPVSWLMSRIEPVSMFRIGLASPCSTLVQIILCFIVLLVILRKEKTTQNRNLNISLWIELHFVSLLKKCCIIDLADK